MPFKFNHEISIGNLITLATVMIAVIGFFLNLDSTVKANASEIAHNISTIQEVKAHREKINEEINEVRESLSRVETDVKWIKEVLKEISKRNKQVDKDK